MLTPWSTIAVCIWRETSAGVELGPRAMLVALCFKGPFSFSHIACPTTITRDVIDRSPLHMTHPFT